MVNTKMSPRGKTTPKRFANAHRLRNVLKNTTGMLGRIASDGTVKFKGK